MSFFLFWGMIFSLSGMDDNDCFAFSNEITVADDDDSLAGLGFMCGSFSGVKVAAGVFREIFFPTLVTWVHLSSLLGWSPVPSLGLLLLGGIETVIIAAVVVVFAVVVVVLSSGDVVLVVF